MHRDSLKYIVPKQFLECYQSTLLCFQGALNPEAEAAVTERFQQSKARLRAELQDQLQSRMEQLDEEHSTLEYVRNKAEISALEAKVGGAVKQVPCEKSKFCSGKTRD